MSTTAPKVSSRDPLRSGLRALAGAAASPALDRIGGRRLMEKALYRGAKGVAEAESAVRGFRRRQGGADPARPAPGKAYADFDLTPTQDQQDILDAVRTFASDILRPAAANADRDRRLPDEIRSAAGELGLHLIGIPEKLGGLATERSAVTAALVLEQLAYADLSIAVALLAPASVANAIAAYGTADQQATYLPEFLGEAPAIAALAMSEPRALADVLDPATTATRNGDEVHVVGVKSLVPLATDARLFIVLARLDGRPQLVIVEAADPGVQVVDNPAMGLRAAATGQLHVDVSIPTDRLLGTDTDALDAVRRARLACRRPRSAPARPSSTRRQPTSRTAWPSVNRSPTGNPSPSPWPTWRSRPMPCAWWSGGPRPALIAMPTPPRRSRMPAPSPPGTLPGSAPMGSRCSAGTASPRNSRMSAGIATCARPACSTACCRSETETNHDQSRDSPVGPPFARPGRGHGG